MQRALDLAATQRGKTSPDPMVGAVLVRDGKIISEGYHSKVRTPHAEAWAIKKAGPKADGATIYVSLEPCCFFKEKNNPPCTQAIIASGIKKVFLSMIDPNPMVSGRGLAELRSAGIDVDVGLLGDEAQKLNEIFVKYVTTKRPFVTLKTAMSLDGKIASSTGSSFWITEIRARKYAHYLRATHDAVMVGIGTVKKDNPELTVRHVRGENPIKIVIDPNLRIPPKAKILVREPEKLVICTTKEASKSKLRSLERKGVRVLVCQKKAGQINLSSLMVELAKMKITSVLVEGGGNLNASALSFGIVDKVSFFIAPKIVGGASALTPVEGRGVKKVNDALKIKDISVNGIGPDILIEGYL